MYYKASLLKQVAAHLKRGGVIAYPTESCYGFGCDPKNYQAIKRILQLKQRNKNKGMIVISSKLNYLEKLIMPLTIEELDYVNQYWPGAYSFVVQVKPHLPANLTGKHRSLAVRVTRHKQVRQLSNYLHNALVSTSANKSGFRAIKTYRECLRQFGKQVLVLPGKTLGAKKPSTIIQLSTRKVLR